VNQPLIVLGDKTSHGGTVISASPFSDTYGKGWARKGDMVSCPLCKGIFPISQGDPGLIDDGKEVAYHGCKVYCGAMLISSQIFTTTVPSSGAEAVESTMDAENEAIQEGFGLIGAGLVAGYQDETLSNKQHFRGRFQVLDQTTGKPVSGIKARVRSTGGQYLTGTTGSDGFTQWVEHEATEALAFDLVQQKP
jgi:uncharacterized Zn-binding protein involved in type VI secretion